MIIVPNARKRITSNLRAQVNNMLHAYNRIILVESLWQLRVDSILQLLLVCESFIQEGDHVTREPIDDSSERIRLEEKHW